MKSKQHAALLDGCVPEQQIKVQRGKTLLWVFLVTVLVVVAGLLWWNASAPIINIQPARVGRITIFDGHTGKSITITNKAEIERVVGNLDSLPLRKASLSLGYMGYAFQTKIYKLDGNLYKSFIIESSDTIRHASFFYKASSNSIDYSYIQYLFNMNGK